MKDRIITCPNCIYERKGKCKLSGEYVSDRQYCDEADDGDYEEGDDCDGYRREVWEYDGFEYFGKTEPRKRKLCCTCKHRIPYVAYDTCDIDGHVMGQFDILKMCCDRWEKDGGRR